MKFIHTFGTTFHKLSSYIAADERILEDGAFFERRPSRRGRRQKNATNLIDGGQQSVSSGEETIEFGQVMFSDHLQGDSSKYLFV